MRRLLLIEPDRIEASTLTRELGCHGLEMAWSSDPVQALELAQHDCFDAALTEFLFASLDATDICADLAARFPVMVLSSVRDTRCVVAALDSGADKYVFKPCPAPELAARIRSLFRRRLDLPTAARSFAGGLFIDHEAMRVSKNGKVLALTPTELRLLLELSYRPGAIVRREVLIENVWGYSHWTDGEALRTTVRRLRGKLEDDPSRPQILLTVRGIGYYLAES